MEALAFGTMIDTDDAKEGTGAFLEKRKAAFRRLAGARPGQGGGRRAPKSTRDGHPPRSYGHAG